MKCDFSDIIKELAWENFMRVLGRYVWRRFGRRAALALAAALIDGPIPIGDIVGLILIIWGVVDTIVGFGELWRAWNRTLANLDQIIAHEVEQWAKEFGDGFLKDKCKCECFKNYLRDLIRASRIRTARLRRTRRRAAKRRLRECIREC